MLASFAVRVTAIIAISLIFLDCAVSRSPVFAAEPTREAVVARFAEQSPTGWGINIQGVLTQRETGQRVVALTFDACTGKAGGYDRELIDFLVLNKLRATLFISGRWINAHEKEFLALAANPLFEIANHGAKHKPLSVNGKIAYGIKGTNNAQEVFDEVEGSAERIEKLTGIRPVFFRSGTAHYDDVAVRLVNAMGYKIAGFKINGDAGGTFSAANVKKVLLSVSGGDIVLFHMNKPGSGTLQGLKEAVPVLVEHGFVFVTLSELFAQD